MTRLKSWFLDIYVATLKIEAMNVLEIDESIDDVKKALGFSVQSVSFYNKTLVLGLWQNHVRYSLVLSIRLGHQSVCLVDQKNKVKSEKKPLLLFANTHLKNTWLIDITRDHKAGRLVELSFASPDSKNIKLAISLIPSVLNISIFSGSKVVHFQKPKPLPESGHLDFAHLKVRDLDSLKKKWSQEFSLDSKSSNKKTSVKNKSIKTIDQELIKKKNAIEKVRGDLKNKKNNDFYEFATLLSENPSQAKKSFPAYFDASKNVHKLKDLYFDKHKVSLVKQARIESRIAELQEEVKSLELMTDSQWQAQQSKQESFKVSFKHPVKTRKLQVASDVIAYLGKSAQDNLKLLRSAKAWHLWLHIKDLPSAHMILFKDKARILSDQEIHKACVWLLSEAKPGQSSGLSQGLVEVLITECRYVRPVKGDKVGRVNYTHEKVYRLRLPAPSL